MNGKEFVEELSVKTGCTDEETEKLISSLSEIIVSSMQEGKIVSLPGFGIMEIKKKKECVLVDSENGKRMLVPPRLVLSFKSSLALKDRITNSKDVER